MGNDDNQVLDIAEIASRTGIAPRRLRYVLDQKVIPLGDDASQGRGSARRFSRYDGFALACAAFLLDAGLRRAVATNCMMLLGRFDRPSPLLHEVPLLWAYSRANSGVLEVGDGINVRLWSGTNSGKGGQNTGWWQASTGAKLREGYEPLVTVRIDIAKLRQRLS
jgi:hypothetical protein